MKMDDKMVLPPSWEVTCISEIGKVITGSTPPTKHENYYGDYIPFVKPPELRNKVVDCASDGLSELGAAKGRTAPRDSILVSCIGNLGKVGITRIPVAFNQQINAILPFAGIDPRFVFYQVQSGFFKHQLENFASATTISIINKGNFERLTFRLAPLDEQRCIVTKIEELFSELDKGVESLKTAREQLKIYRQAVLKHAFEGKLTVQWREANKDKLESPDQLLARIQAERQARYQQQVKAWEVAVKEWEANGKEGKKSSKPKAPQSLPSLSKEELTQLPELPEGWIWTRFGLLDIDLKRGPFGSAITKSMFVPSGFKVYEQGNAIYRDATRGTYYIDSQKYLELIGFAVSPGDFIVSCAGTVGRIFELSDEAPAGIINQALMRVRINEQIFCKDLFSKLFESDFFQRKILSDAKGTAMVNLAGIKELNLVPVAFCGGSEQVVINGLLEAELSRIDQLEETLTTSLGQAEPLRQSILKKAFSGQLVPQDPNDEPASALLERIRAEKAEQTTGGKAKTKPEYRQLSF
jgi:type I restriction enzyme S subunit